MAGSRRTKDGQTIAVPVGTRLEAVLELAYRARRSALLEGPTGVGKSEIVRAVARRLGLGTVVLDLSLLEPPDLVGLPVIDSGRTLHAVPGFLPRDGAGILMLEELNRAERYIQQPALQLLTARRLHDYDLPPDWVPFAAINPENGEYQVTALDPALRARFLALLLYLAFAQPPILPGEPREFWLYACGVKVGGLDADDVWPDGSIYPPIDGGLVYYVQTHHQQYLFRLPVEEADAYLSDVQRELDTGRDYLHEPIDPDVQTGYRRWLETTSKGARNALTLASQISAARRERLKAEQPEQYRIERREERFFRHRWARAQRVWLTVAFEATWLTAWILFTAWPWIRRASPARCALHLGLSPVLLALPLYLGYAPYTFTFGPSGGFLYPVLAHGFLLPLIFAPRTIVDQAVVASIPPLLEPLSQPVGPARAVTFFGYVPPLALLGFGLALGVQGFLLGQICVRRRR